VRLLRVLSFLLLASSAGFAAAQQDRALSERMDRIQKRINVVAARAERVDAVQQLANLQATFGYLFDKGLWDDVADLFAENGCLELGLNGVYVGRDSMRSYLYSLSGGRLGLRHGQVNNHFQVQPVITLSEDGQSARARWNTLIQTADFDESGHGGEWGAGVYENEYVKEDGVWKISRMRLYLEFYAPYEHGWTGAPADMTERYLTSEVPPDRPPSGDHRPYPAFDVAPFHYDHPVRSGYRFELSGAEKQRAMHAAPPVMSDGTVSALEAQVRDLELRVERLKAYHAIENIASTYGYYVDQSMGDAVADLFVEDGTLEILGRGVFIGKPRITTYMRRLGCCGPVEGTLYNHFQIQPVIHVSDDAKTAKMRARLMVMFARDEQSAQWGEGVYENTFVNDRGVWKYRNLHAFQTFYTTYEDGWGRYASPLFSYFDGFPPDRPHSIEYEPYPAYYVPPFHYPNPVTGKPIRVPESAQGESE